MSCDHSHPIAAGKSSFGLIDPSRLFAALPLRSARQILDLACGAGAYSLELARRLPASTIHAVDLWAEGLDSLRQAAATADYPQIRPQLADVGQRLPFADGSIDLCLAATVLHDLVITGDADSAIAEIARLLPPRGYLAVIEFVREESSPGPPSTIRLAPAQLEALITPCGFRSQPPLPVGEHLYLMLFERC